MADTTPPEQLLTDDEIDAMATQAFCDYMRDRNDDQDLAFARAIERALLARLAEQEPMTAERIDRIAELTIKGMPDGIQGFLKTWGWQQFARALLDIVPPPAARPVAQGELDPRTATETARKMIAYCQSFNGQQWGGLAPQSVDRQNLATALDNLEETAAMLLNVADRLASRSSAQGAAQVPQAEDSQLLDFLGSESLDLRCFSLSDDDVGWRTVQHHQGRPAERVASEVYRDDPRQAIREAMAHLQRDPYCTGPLHEADAAPHGEGDAS